MYRWQAMNVIAEHGVVGIIRAETAQQAGLRARTCLDAGLSVLEISLTTPNAPELIKELRREYPSALLGAGTVLDAAAAWTAVEAGAGFLVSPSLHEEVVSTGHRYGAAVIPGTDTPGEIVQALSAGADAIKLFPASRWTPESMRDVLAALPQAPLVPTGGVSLDNAPDWIAAGAVAVGMGSALSRGSTDEATERISDLRTRIRAARG
ncbi:MULTISPECIES: bifunctional 4-hydroxy-2-oxoglutarate aldolase/2-dehydro-3-deoxy-phosphogluconate aldolase [unclassified Actinopolyspora]|uniref:bifunctional 4-hydroxy-2-oxoglutarate aldolase/2-dehydro-3-deoxy-phosphogluconate aldolase n=1 Tax=unclassified Actinopolyspora TaxID=2639451 RepID=UPI0013F65542|nr:MULTISPECIES: bifunctional 4-hydroxy-2-oxoglutarate aldolase/2-dehydro-3-deoxy-phosphogluconate aldolase [unclassified Actinopolyspora]NHD19093.1 bifunctional 4-hydroxy-2-oxoglutarate aldolase/2-dehydro-3-deoxy-phosphogluconate aldolase [Actinopolyspora sp. BKK2]NHE78122.1 bifunctional 4-hydroxy-2-oxoglutarate aldolase/2-dehydro-3-deoxy-phosphogluconate aldolase [Actinopolyspora sp. BKK1]